MNFKAKKYLLLALALPFSLASNAQTTWKMAASPIATRWAKQVNPDQVLPEYPRPQMARANWTNLNGLWDYAITSKESNTPQIWEGKILVPYPLESALSGVKKKLLPEQHLWYKKTFNHIALKSNEKVKLNFGAVDYQCWIFVNGKEVGTHEGGYTAFSFDITTALKAGSNEITVKVYDPTDQGVGPHGKQVLNPENIYYTPTSGIWQTVWLETVPATSIEELVITPDIDKALVNIQVNAKTSTPVTVNLAGKTYKGRSNTMISIPMKNAKLWSPADPYLYDLEVNMGSDKVKSYFGMRKVSVGKDAAGNERILLNNKPYFNLGTLDQGFWPEGLYTAPTDEALAFDIKAIKAMGFNTIRKHIKVEPARWYYHADKLGMLVWQDMVNPNQGLPEGSKAAFEKQSAEILKQLHNYPSITTWVLFNEKWGQYDQARLTSWIKKTDPSRIVNGHSGEFLYVNEKLRSPSPDAYVNADMTDVHAYPDPMMSIALPGKARVCGEFGGIGVFVPDHQWITGSAWGYVNEKPAGLKAKYTIMNQHMSLFEKQGLSGSIYTQPFDVEGEQNGLMTYDREVIKIPFAELRKIHSALNPDAMAPSWIAGLGNVTATDADLTEPAALYSSVLAEYIAGKREPAFLKRMAILASQAGDKPGIALAGSAYIASLTLPLSDEDKQSVISFTKTTRDPGYQLIAADSGGFRKLLGDRKYTTTMMNLIYAGEMQELIEGAASVDWDQVAARVAPFGAPGQEILMRAKTVEFYNRQDWKNFATAGSAYLAQFGEHLPEEERKQFQEAVDQHKVKE